MAQPLRIRRLEEQIKEELAVMIQQEIKDPDIRLNMTTVMAVELNGDLSLAKVFISVLGDKRTQKTVIEALKKATGMIRRNLAKRIRVRRMPELRFYPDDQIENLTRLEEIYHELHKQAEENGARDPFDEVINQLSLQDEFLIVSHEYPDGDALGSQVALALGLRKLGKNVQVFNRGPIPECYVYLTEGMEWVEDWETMPRGRTGVFLDAASQDRLIGEGFDRFKNRFFQTINIDHHASNSGYGDFNWVDPGYSAVGLMVYDILKRMEIDIDRDIAVALFTAIYTDTGRFSFGNADARSFEAATELVQCGAVPRDIFGQVYASRPLEQIHLLQRAMGTLEVDRDSGLATLYASRAMMRDTGARYEHTEGIIEFAATCRDVGFVVFFKELEEGRVKASIRSKNGRDATLLALKFGGGGHPAAAGYSLDLGIEDAIAKTRETYHELYEEN